jgi:hypothetical protein
MFASQESRVIAEPSLAAVSEAGQARTARVRSWLLPSLSDVLFFVLLSILFMSGSGWSELLADSDTGWHIRTGEYILRAHTVPVWDLFSYTDPGTHWYAWEWLADVLFAALHQAAGLKGVVLFSGAVICLTMIILFRHIMWRGASLHVAVVLTIFIAQTLRFHYLARPHIFTTLFGVIALWVLDRDWSRPSRAVWMLVPLTVLWTNVHGGFLILIVALGCFAVSGLLRREVRRFARYSILGVACAAATLVNPYGWQLHIHIWEYLRSDWLMRNIDEFQSPLFRQGSILPFEILLILGLVCTWELLRTRRYHEALLLIFWAHEALTSARHITIFAVVVAPMAARQLSLLWDEWTQSSTRRSVKGVLRDLMIDMSPASRSTSIWVPVFLLLLASGLWGVKWPADFPSKFPTELLARNASLLNGPGRENVRMLSPDAWGGYLDYKFYPNRRVFIDGRSDYYGLTILKEYISVRAAGDNWQELAARYGWQFALIPPDWALSRALKQSPDWILRDQDNVALLFERRPKDAVAQGGQ